MKLALFDFDGTITDRDTLMEFIKYSRGSASFYFGMFWLSPILLAYKVGWMKNWRAKERVMSYFWSGRPQNELSKLGDQFSKIKIPLFHREEAIQRIQQYQEDGWKVVVVSASPYLWLKSWASDIGVELIATHLEVEDGRLTGRIKGKNCYGEEKVRRIKEAINLEDMEMIHAYGDTSGDRPMLALAGESYYKPFR